MTPSRRRRGTPSDPSVYLHMTQSEVVAAKVPEMFDGKTPVRIADVVRAQEMNYRTCKPHLHRAANMNLLQLVLRKGIIPSDGPRRKVSW